MIIAKKIKIILILLGFINNIYAKATELAFNTRPEVKNFIDLMVTKHNFDPLQLDMLFKKYAANPEVLQKMAKPSERLTWGQYKKLLISEDRINKGKYFIQQYNKNLLQAEQKWGVPKELITAVLGIESSYGMINGKFPTLQTLATLAFDYPSRSKLFKSELEHFLLLTKEEKLDPIKLMGSYAGAMGPAQFMASSYRNYAVDFANIGSKNLDNMVNAIGSIANYFKQHGWKYNQNIVTKLSVQEFQQHKKNKNNNILELILENQQKEHWLKFDNFVVITKYNNSNNYAMAVYLLANSLGLNN